MQRIRLMVKPKGRRRFEVYGLFKTWRDARKAMKRLNDEHKFADTALRQER